MPRETAVLNIDVDFINKPELIGNNYASQDFVSYSDIKTNLRTFMDVDEIIKKLALKRKFAGQITNSAEQIIPFYRRLVDKDVLKPREFTFIHIGAHCNVYSYGDHSEYNFKKEMHDYKAYNAFAYFFVKKYIGKLIWVYPDRYTDEMLDKHFNMMDYQKRNGMYLININQGLKFVIHPIRWRDFTLMKYDWKAITIVANPYASNFKPDDLHKFKSIIL